MIGNLHLTAAGAADSWKRRRIEYNASQESNSVNQLMQVNKTLAAANDYGMARRAASMFARLHPAKYLKMDPLLKELFFPTLNYKQAFGFTSVSCINQGSGQTSGMTTGVVATDNRNKSGGIDQPSNDTEWSKPRGPFRGFACFTLRSSRIAEPTTSTAPATSGKLNTKQIQVGGCNLWSGGAGATSDPVYSHYRRFFNGPVVKTTANQTVQGNANVVQMLDCPSVQPATPEKNSALSVSEVGFRGQLEQIAARACPFVPSNSRLRGPTAFAAPQTTSSSNQSYCPPSDQTYRILNDSGKYYQTVLNDNFRICDGYLEMDISNGKVAPVLIEIVIHSFKKQFHEASGNTLLDALFKSIWNSVQMSQRSGTGGLGGGNFDTTQGTDNNNDNMSGGWQAFYDPAYPLLKTKKSMDQHSESIAHEVHRSSHVLSPGQTKLVRISLGSLYYSLGGQTKGPGAPQSNVQAFSQPVPMMGPGSLLVTVGHSGFEMLSAPAIAQDPASGLFVYPDSVTGNTHNVPGSGFWVGKQHTASEIVVSGKYCEKFYPMQPGTDPGDRVLANSKPGIPYVEASGIHLGLPAMQPVTEVIGTTNANDQSYPANSVSGDRPGTQATQ